MSPSKPTSVVHIITKFAVGGAQESALATLQGLPAREFGQLLICGTEVDAEGSLLREARETGIQIELEPALVREISPAADLKATWRISRRLRRIRPDIVHTHSSKAGLIGRVAARVARVPHVVHSVHGWSFNDQMARGVRATYVAAERIAARMTDALIVESSTDLPKGLGRRIGSADKYVLIRNGIDLARFENVNRDDARRRVRAELNIPIDAWVAGSVGRLADQKDPLLMVEAFVHVTQRVKNAHFVWVGDGPLRHDVERHARALGVAESFHLAGVRRDVPDVLASFDAFALSSRWEGLPRTVTEAMTVALPVVATSVDGTVEAVDDGVNGFLVPSGDADALGAALVRLAADRGLAERLGEAGRARSRWFSRDVMNEDVATLYRRLLAGQPVANGRRPLRVTHVISGLQYGGAERQLSLLVQSSDPSRVRHAVVSLTELGPIGHELRSAGIDVTACGMSFGRSLLPALVRLRRHLARSGADVVQTWLYHADLLGGLAARSLRLPVVWNVRMTWMDPVTAKTSTIRVAQLCSHLSRFVPERIVFNSRAGAASHSAHGYEVSRAVIIGNAVDTTRFNPDPDASVALKKSLGLSEDDVVIGAVARFDPQKGHDVLLEAARTVIDATQNVHLVLVGRGCGVGDEPISTMVREAGLTHRVHLLGSRADIAEITAGLDVAISASLYGESSSNAIAEALAAGVPVIATNVGAARELIGSAGIVVAPGSARELASAIESLLSLDEAERRVLSKAAVKQSSDGGVEQMVERYLDLYREVLGW